MCGCLSKFCGRYNISNDTLIIIEDLPVSLYFLMLFIPDIIMLDLGVFFQLLNGFSSTGSKLYIYETDVSVPVSADIH